MKKLIIMLFFLAFYQSSKGQQWAAVPGYSISYGDVIGVTRYQGNLWVETTTGIYKISGSLWELTTQGISVMTTKGCLYTDGVDLYAGALFQFGVDKCLVIKWDSINSLWTPIAYTESTASGVYVATILKTQNFLHVGGSFSSIGSSPLSLAPFHLWGSFNGVVWTQIFPIAATGCASVIESIQKLQSNDSIFIAGGFHQPGNVWSPATFKFKESDAGITSINNYGSCSIAKNYVFYNSKTYVAGIRQHEVLGYNTGLAVLDQSNNWGSVSGNLRLVNTRVVKFLGKLFILGESDGGLFGVPTNAVSYDGVVLTNIGTEISRPNNLGVTPLINVFYLDTVDNKLFVGGNFLQLFGNVCDNFAVYHISVVPVNLSSFSASLQNEKVLLHWRDETPEDNVVFEVQYSVNGRDFHSVGKLKEFANRNDYSFLFTSQECGGLFFRLAFQGKYSSVISVSLNCNTSIVGRAGSVYCSSPTTSKVIVRDIVGRLLVQKVINGNLEIPLSRGVYIISFVTNSSVFTRKIFVQ